MTNHYEVRYLVNYYNGIWTGPHRIVVGGRTLLSAWATTCSIMLAENSDIQFFSLVGWRTTPPKVSTDAITVVKSLREIAAEHRQPKR